MTKPVQCPFCQLVITREINPQGATPNRGDLLVCFKCGMPSRYDREMNLRKLTKTELEGMPKFTKDMLVASMAVVNDAKQRRN